LGIAALNITVEGTRETSTPRRSSYPDCDRKQEKFSPHGFRQA
jgi:hypothetical protein